MTCLCEEAELLSADFLVDVVDDAGAERRHVEVVHLIIIGMTHQTLGE